MTWVRTLASLASARRRHEHPPADAARAEGTARQRAELLERIATHLTESTTVRDVAAVTASDLCRAGIPFVAVFESRGERIELLARCAVRPEAALPDVALLERAASAAMRSGEIVEGTGSEPSVAVPFRTGVGGATGALVAVVPDTPYALETVRLLVSSVAEQCGVAFGRARLAARERAARQREHAIQALSSRLSSALVPLEVAEAAAKSLAETFGTHLSAVGIASPEGLDVVTLPGDVPTVSRPGDVEPELSFGLALPPGITSLAARLANAGTVLEAHGRRQLEERCGPEAAVELDAQGVLSLMFMPLNEGEGIVGVMFSRIRVLSGAERELLEGVRDRVSQALERTALFERERDARRRAELLEGNAAHLAVARTPAEVGVSTVSEVEGYGADVVVVVWRLAPEAELVELAASASVADAASSLARHELVAEALGTNALATVRSGREYRSRFPRAARHTSRPALECLSAVPLRSASGAIVGAMLVGSKQRGWLTAERRRVVLGVAGQTGVALERALLFETEREARLLAELLEGHAAHLAVSVTTAEVAAATVADLERAGFVLASLHERRPEGIELLASVGASPEALDGAQLVPLDSGALVAEAIRVAEPIELGTGEALDAEYPQSSARRMQSRAETVFAVPLRGTVERVIGVLVIGSTSPHWLSPARKNVIHGVAEQCGVALERAQLQAERDRAADASSFLAELADVLERETTAVDRARCLTALLATDRARFAAVHLLDGPEPVLAASEGERPSDLRDESAWERRVRRAVAVAMRRGDGQPPTAAGGDSVVLPLLARGRAIGALTLVPGRDGRRGAVVEPEIAREIAARAAIQLDNALIYERERDASHALQLGLLGGGIAPFDGLAVSATYRAGTELLEIGGDWHDAFHLPDGGVALVVGDVVGHGLDAAVTMARLRGAVAALAQSGGPGPLLERLDEFIENVPAAMAATLAYVELGPEGAVRYACAGHPPPLVVSADGETRFLWGGRSAPLGSVFGRARNEAEDRLDEGETLFLYTDGLIERRSESLEVGFGRLAKTAALLTHAGDGLADELSDALLEGHRQDDDVCVLAVHRVASAPSFRHAFSADPRELRPLRLQLGAWLEENGVEREVAWGTVLAASEAAANAVEHGYAGDGSGIVVVSARLEDGRMRLTVRDEGEWRSPPAEGDRGRGFRLIEAVMNDVSVDHSSGATVVTMSQSVRAGTPA